MTIGHCKHGEFILEEGCPKCIEERGKANQKSTYIDNPSTDTPLRFEPGTGDVPLRYGDPRSAASEYILDQYELGSLVEPDPEFIPVEVEPTQQALIKVNPQIDAKITTLYQEGIKLLEYAQNRIIETNEDLKPATDDLAIIAKLKKALEEKKNEYIIPIREHLKAVNDSFAAFMAPFIEADSITRSKITEFRRIEQDKRDLANREAAARGGTYTTELQTPVPDRTHTAMGTQGFQKVYKWEVIDFSKVPDQYKIPDAGKITGVVKGSKGTIEIPGIRIWTEETVRINTK